MYCIFIWHRLGAFWLHRAYKVLFWGFIVAFSGFPENLGVFGLGNFGQVVTISPFAPQVLAD